MVEGAELQEQLREGPRAAVELPLEPQLAELGLARSEGHNHALLDLAEEVANKELLSDARLKLEGTPPNQGDEQGEEQEELQGKPGLKLRGKPGSKLTEKLQGK